MNKYVSPGVYVVEGDITTIYPPKKFNRIRKIARIFTK